MANDLELPNKKKKFKKIIIIAGLALVILSALGGGAWYYFYVYNPSVVDEEPLDQFDKIVEIMPAGYVILPKPFVFNLSGDRRGRVAQVRAQLMVRGSDNESLARRNLPLIQDALISVFSKSNYKALIQANGRIKLRQDATVEVQKVLEQAENSKVIERVLFTDFVIQ